MGSWGDRSSSSLAHARRDEPLWVLLLVGWLSVQTVLDRRRASAVAALSASEQAADRPGVADPACAPPRELRRLPGIGEVRALAIARARWEHSAQAGAFRLEDVPGIGPLTARRVERFLEDGGLAPGGAENSAEDDDDQDASPYADGAPEPTPDDGRDSGSEAPRRSGAANPTLHSSAQPGRRS